MRTITLMLLLPGLAMAGPPDFVVAALRVLPERWDKEANVAKLDRFARQAASQGAKLVITPEGFLDGYIGNDRDLDRGKYFSVAEPLDGPMLKRVSDLARELKIYLSFGFSESRGDRVYNSVVIFGPEGAIVTRYSKTHCGSELHNTQGDEFPVVDTPLGRWGTLICLDRQLPETSRILAIKGAQLLLVPSYGMHGEINDVLMRTRAYENSVWVVFAHPKRSLIIDPKGTVVAKDDGGGDQIVSGRIVLDGAGRGPIRHRRPEIYGEILRPK
jgi:predicted amidohydrolase